MLILTAADVKSVISMAEAVEASAEAFRLVADGKAMVPARHHFAIDDGFGSVALVMSGFLPSAAALGVKIASLFPDNYRRGIAATNSTILLLDPQTGELLCLMEGAWLTALRTGAGVGAAIRWLAREDCATFGLLGAGGMAYHQVEAALAVRPSLRRVLIWNRTAARAEALVAELRQDFPDRATFAVVASAEAAVREADIVTASTAAIEPVICGAWVRPGTHVNVIGAHGRDMRESDDDLIRMSAVRAVDMHAAAMASGELLRPIAAGAATKDDFVDVGAVALGRVAGRQTRDEVTWFKSGGIAAQDLTTAKLVHQAALARGLGTPFSLT